MTGAVALLTGGCGTHGVRSTAVPVTAPAAPTTASTGTPSPRSVDGASAATGVVGSFLAVSSVSSSVVQAQPPAGTCRSIGSDAYALPDRRCTPGALNPAVTQATIGATICRSGYSASIRPSERVTEREKIASMAAYGDQAGPSAYEYDHLVSLELGGAANDPRNLWPEPGASPNPKDSLEDRLHADVCAGAMPLATAQRLIATDWVGGYRTFIGSPATPAATAPSAAPQSARGLCSATVSDARPPRGGEETVTVQTTAAARVQTIAHYKTTSTEHDGTASAGGLAAIRFSIGHPAAGYTVDVEVTTSSEQSCTTSFTPQ